MKHRPRKNRAGPRNRPNAASSFGCDLFIAYQADLEQGFIAVQNRLKREALEEYIKPIWIRGLRRWFAIQPNVGSRILDRRVA